MSNEFDDLGFDPVDTELGGRLRAAAPDAGDADAVLAALRPRLVQARRRRRAGFVAAGAATLALLAGVAFAVADTAPRDSVNVPPANRSTPAPGPRTTDTQQPAPSARSDATTRDDGSTSGAPGTTASDAGARGSHSAPATPPATADDHGGSGSSSGSGSGSDDNSNDDSGSDDSESDDSESDDSSSDGSSDDAKSDDSESEDSSASEDDAGSDDSSGSGGDG